MNAALMIPELGHVALILALCLAVLAFNVAQPILARRRYLQDEARRLRREKQQ